MERSSERVWYGWIAWEVSSRTSVSNHLLKPKFSPLLGLHYHPESFHFLHPGLILMNLQSALPQTLSCQSTHPVFSKPLFWIKLSVKVFLAFLSSAHSQHTLLGQGPYWSLRQRKNVCMYQNTFPDFEPNANISESSIIKIKKKTYLCIKPCDILFVCSP